MSLDRYPALKKALFNQYQAILVGGAAAFSALIANPLPLLIVLGAEFMTVPFLVDRMRRRIEIEKKYAARQATEITQEQQYEDIPAASKVRFQKLRQLCDRIQANYRGLSAASQGILADQARKFETILAAVLRRLWLLHKLDDLVAATDGRALAEEIGDLQGAIEKTAQGTNLRVREALEKNLMIKRELLETLASNAQNREALAAEIESLESLLELLLQKSVAATDAAAFSADIDDVLHQVEADAASVEEMERMLGDFPALEDKPVLSPRLRQATPPPPPPPTGRQRSR